MLNTCVWHDSPTCVLPHTKTLESLLSRSLFGHQYFFLGVFSSFSRSLGVIHNAAPSHVWKSNDARVNMSYYTCEWVVVRIWMRHVTQIVLRDAAPTLFICAPTWFICAPTSCICAPMSCICAPASIICAPTIFICAPTIFIRANVTHVCA